MTRNVDCLQRAIARRLSWSYAECERRAAIQEVAMKRPALVWLLIIGLAAGFLMVPAAPSYAWRHGHGGRGLRGGRTGLLWGPPESSSWYSPPHYPPVLLDTPHH